MTERLFSLEEVTAAMSPAFKQAQKETNVDRALRIFTDIAVDRLKALALETDSDELKRDNPRFDYWSPND
jgi:hypothetical protein